MPRRILAVPIILAIAAALTGVGLAAANDGTGRAPYSSAVPASTSARAASVALCGTATKAPKYKHVIVIFMENNSYSTIMGSSSTPYIHSLAKSCGSATNYHNVSHPSLPNYLAVTSGGSVAQVTTPFVTDCTPSTACESSSDNIFHQLNSAGRKWKGYAESMPSNCGKSDSGFYAPRHNPAVYYTDLANCASRDVPLGTAASSPLFKDFSKDSSAPAYAWITPNLCSDMHGATGCPSNLLQTGDNWLKKWIPKIASTAVYKKHDTVIFLAWDEGEGGSSQDAENCATNTTDVSCHVVSIVIAPSVKPGHKVATLFNHYSLLKTSEDLLGLPELGQAKTATSMAKAFNL